MFRVIDTRTGSSVNTKDYILNSAGNLFKLEFDENDNPIRVMPAEDHLKPVLKVSIDIPFFTTRTTPCDDKDTGYACPYDAAQASDCRNHCGVGVEVGGC